MTICTSNAVLPESNLRYPFCAPVRPTAAAANPLIDLQQLIDLQHHRPVDPE